MGLVNRSWVFCRNQVVCSVNLTQFQSLDQIFHLEMPYFRRTSKTWESKEGAVLVMYLGSMEYVRGKSEKEVRRGVVLPCHGFLGCLLKAKTMPRKQAIDRLWVW